MSVTGVYEWGRRHPTIVDGMIAAFLWMFLVAVQIQSSDLIFWLSTAQVVPLIWRRRFPEAVAAVSILVCLAQVPAFNVPMPSHFAVPIVLYSVAAYARSRRLAAAVLGVAFVGTGIAVVDWTGAIGTSLTERMFAAGSMALMCGVTWLFGDLIRHRRAVVSRLEEQNLALERDRHQREALAAQAERSRIAREMHDVVAHSLSVIVVQADGAAYTAGLDAATAGSPSHRALETIAATAREALAETRRLVGVLREAREVADYAPQATLADVDALVGRLHDSGLDVRLHHHGTPTPRRRDVELAAYRIVQEALTNVIKHAGPGVHVDVHLHHCDPLVVQIDDDGRGASAAPNRDGNGLLGMRERAGALGGTLSTGPRSGGGFRVRAELPAATTPVATQEVS